MKKESKAISNSEVEAVTTVIESNKFSPSMHVKINPEYSKLIYPLSKSEYKILKGSISNNGLHLPIIVNQDNVILDGHNRLKICQELGIEPHFEVIEFKDSLQEKEFVIEINLKRRHLNTFQLQS